MVLLRSEKF